MKDFELENLAIDDLDHALEYIGKDARSKNIFQGNKPRKPKSNHSKGEIPLNVINQINPKGIKNHGTQSQNC
jgi:hypothetical protein